MKTLTVTEARARGFEAQRGNYIGTIDDHADRWYIVERGKPTDKRGNGFATQREALEALAENLND